MARIDESEKAVEKKPTILERLAKLERAFADLNEQVREANSSILQIAKEIGDE